MAFDAQYFDGESARQHDVSLEAGAGGLRISGDSIKNTVWTYDGLKSSHKAVSGQELRLGHVDTPAARLIIPPGLPSERVCERAPHLTASAFNVKTVARGAGWVAATMLLVVGVLYGLLNLAPKSLAGLMPREWSENVGKQTEKTVIKSARQCTDKAGQRALLKLAGKVASGANSPPDFSVRVFDMKMMNAFAVAGGRLVFTRGLIETAKSPGEVAGVMAHELGHIAHRHPEASLVRVLGLQLLISFVTGGGGNETLGNLAGFATLMSYSRDAEREADLYADKILKNAKIDTSGLINFFKRVKKKEDKLLSNKSAQSLFSILSTHPLTQERIAKLTPLPKGEAIEVLTPIEWRALKNLCNKTTKGSKI